MFLYVGSEALLHVAPKFFMFPETKTRPIKDVDAIAHFDDAIKYLKGCKCDRIEPLYEGKKLHGIKYLDGGELLHYEIELAWPDSTAEKLLNIVWDTTATAIHSFAINEWDTFPDWRFADLNTLYTLKMSHRYRKNSPHFRKTMGDIRVMRKMGAEIPESLRDWLRERERETYNYTHPKLNTTREKFFSSDAVSYKYDHDSIHQAIKLGERPAYDYFKPDTKEVFCSEKMFNLVSDEIRLNAVYEESAVLALERSIIPHPGVLTPKAAFSKALEKVCTSITSGWFREFSWENYERVIGLYDSLVGTENHFLPRFENGLKTGIIKPFVKV